MIAVKVASRGASPLRSRQRRIAAAARPPSSGKTSSAEIACPGSGCRANSNAVTTPKLPPPPRSAQSRSGCESASTCSTSPFAVTSSNETTLSHVSPCRRASQPMPPPRVRPPTPVCDTFPAVVARPCACDARSSAPRSAPPCTMARRLRGSTVDGAHRAQVDHEPVVGHGVPDDAVPAGADPELEPEISGVSHGRDDIGRLRASHDVARSSVDHPVPHRARLVVAGIARLQHAALDRRLQGCPRHR